jgi:hypothetical protein
VLGAAMSASGDGQQCPMTPSVRDPQGLDNDLGDK